MSDVFSVADLPFNYELQLQGFSPEGIIATTTVEKPLQDAVEDILRATDQKPYRVPTNEGDVHLDHGSELTPDLQYWLMAGQTLNGRKVRALFSPAADGTAQITIWLPLQPDRTVMTFSG